MATKLPLPKLSDLPEVVVFHRTHPSENRILLQIPTSESTSESYVIRTDWSPDQRAEDYNPRQDHAGWLKRLPNYQRLMDLLSIEAHVAYYPKNGGACQALQDPEQKPWMKEVMAGAARGQATGVDRYFAKRQLRGRMMRKQQDSPFRSALKGARGARKW